MWLKSVTIIRKHQVLFGILISRRTTVGCYKSQMLILQKRIGTPGVSYQSEAVIARNLLTVRLGHKPAN